ncbi:hypothetical protein JHK85_000499 [Glycine max]|nr:hypothetical protein JHK85_000499 [Glycine max]KAG5087880.1 hypothetical protein JHK86_000492 [Glycine max]
MAVNLALHFHSDCLLVRSKSMLISSPPPVVPYQWSPPSNGFLKCNFDATLSTKQQAFEEAKAYALQQSLVWVQNL